MRRAILVLSLTLLGLIAAGCSNSAPETTNTEFPYIGGLEALKLSFGPGQPPNTIFDDGQSIFNVGLFIQNVGESAVGPGTRNTYGYFELLGINPGQFGLSEQQTKIYFEDVIDGDTTGLTLLGSRRGYEGDIILGEIGVVEFPEMTYLPDRVGNAQITLRANACYEYTTFTDADICIKDNVLENAQDDTICTLTGAKPFMSSSGPVQVTELTQYPAGSDKIQVSFVLENLGIGQVFAPVNSGENSISYSNPNLRIDPLTGRPDACYGSVGANPSRNVVLVKVSVGEDYGGSAQFDVSCPMLRGGGPADGTITLFQDSPAVITCTIKTSGAGSRIFVERLHIDAHYTYLDYIEMPLLIRDTNVGVERGFDSTTY